MTAAAAGRIGPAVRWVVTDRAGGVSAPPYDSLNLADHVGDEPAAVAENRGRVAARLDVPVGRLVSMRPAHGRDVAVLDEDAPSEVAGVDALVTDRPGLVLLALGADCVPVLLADPRAGVVAAVHAGWRGVAADVVGAALAAMAALGAEPGRTRAVIGPAICPACYPVSAECRDEVAAVNPAAASRTADGSPALDLRAGILGRLRRDGIAAELVGTCTAEDPSLFSFRRDGVTGRQGAAIVRVTEAGGPS